MRIAATLDAPALAAKPGQLGWMDWACILDYGRLCEALMAKGFDALSPNKDGNSPLTLCAINRSGQCARSIGPGATSRELGQALALARLHASRDFFSARPPDLLAMRRSGFENAILGIMASREALAIGEGLAPAAARSSRPAPL